MINHHSKIALFGGTGFIGSYLTDELINSNFKIRMLVRNISNAQITENIEYIKGDLSNTSSIENIINRCGVVIYAVGIIRENRKQGITFERLHYEYFKNVVDISNKHNIKKIVYLSANGVSENGTTYQITKFKAEQYLKANFDNWTIFQPSVVFGNPKNNIEFVTQLMEDIIEKNFPAPLFFRFNPFYYNDFFKSTPIHVKNLAQVIVKSIDTNFSDCKTFKIGGPTIIGWSNMLKLISRIINKRKIFIPVPILAVFLMSKLFDRFQSFPITSTQIQMLKEDNICDSKDLFKNNNIEPLHFTEENLQYLKN